MNRVLVACSVLWVLVSLATTVRAQSSIAALRPKVAVFREEGIPTVGQPSSPARIAKALQEAGIDVGFLSAHEMADATVFNTSRFDLVILPYGETFPYSAKETFLGFLRAGGHFVSIGGYAFNNLVVKRNGAWVSCRDLKNAAVERGLEEPAQLIDDCGFENTRDAPISSPIPSRGIPGSRTASQWARSDPSCTVTREEPCEGRWCARVDGTAGVVRDWHAEIRAEAGRLYRFRAHIRSRDIVTPGYGFVEIYEYDDGGRFVTSNSCAKVFSTLKDWKPVCYEFVPADRTRTLVVRLGTFLCAGTMYFDDVRIGVIDESCDFRPLNSSSGVPLDALVITNSQLPLFDADFPLARVASIEAAAGQYVIPSGVNLKGSFEGWAASAIRGGFHYRTPGRGRWIPLLVAKDRYGRVRGSAGSVLMNYEGTFKGSHWAFFGVDNDDLFGPDHPELDAVLANVVRFLVRGTYARKFKSDLAMYRDGEPVVLELTVENTGAQGHKGKASIDILADGAGEAVFRTDIPVEVSPRESSRFAVEWKPGVFGCDLYRAVCTLWLDGRPEDQIETGFAVHKETAMSRGIPLQFKDNYLELGGRPTFILGTDMSSDMYYDDFEDPWTWSRDILAARDFGFMLYENLFWSRPDYTISREDWRKLEAMAQLTQKYHLLFMPCTHTGHGIEAALDPAEMKRSLELCKSWTDHLGAAPGLIWYIWGEVSCRYHRHGDGLKRAWNEYLADKYGTNDRLADAWGKYAPQERLGNIPYAVPHDKEDWTSVPAIDRFLFDMALQDRCAGEHVKSFRSAGATHPTTSEYYDRPTAQGADMRLGIDGQDMANTGLFWGPAGSDDIAERLRWNDMRSTGKSIGVGEYGAKTHPAWRWTQGGWGIQEARTHRERQRLELATIAYAYGMGASRINSWQLRDLATIVFPWGSLYQHQLVPKNIAFTQRNMSLLLRRFPPQYTAAPLTLLLPDMMRAGNRGNLGYMAATNAIRALHEIHVDFNVLNDSDIAQLPAETKAVIYPCPFSIRQDVFERLSDFVRRGGILYLSGDFGYDAARRRTRAARLAELAGVESAAFRFPDARFSTRQAVLIESADEGFAFPEYEGFPCQELRPAGAEVVARATDGKPVIVKNRVGRGRVLFSTDPIEIRTCDSDTESLRAVYSAFVQWAGLEPFAVTPDSPDFHVFRQPTTDGGEVWVLFDTRAGSRSTDVEVATSSGSLMLRVANGYPALAAITGKGRVVALSGWETIRLDDKCFAEMKSRDPADVRQLALCSLDGKDLGESSALMVLPFGQGRLTFAAGHFGEERSVEVGDFHEGHWRVLEQITSGPERKIGLAIDGDRATGVILVCRRAQKERWRRHLEESLINPHRLSP